MGYTTEFRGQLYFKNELTDKFRSPHLWTKVNGVWKLRHNVCKTGADD